MRTLFLRSLGLSIAWVGATIGASIGLAACSGSSGGSGFNTPPGADGGPANMDSGNNIPPGSDGMAPILNGDGSGGTDALTDGEVTTTVTVYANTDDTLYSLDPKTNALTMIGKFAGTGDASNNSTITDCAVNAAGEVYVNSETVVFKAALPASPGGAVNLTQVATIAVASGQKFYALAFVPTGVLGSGEALIGGDDKGELWSIDTTGGATKDLGNFGPDPNAATPSIFALSGDVVFYMDANNKPTGLATIRSCTTGTYPKCVTTNDYLAGIDMTALAAAYNGSKGASLLLGIYGGMGASNHGVGNGTGYGDLFGLGAWEGNVYAFQRATKTNGPQLISINATTGVGMVIPTPTVTFTMGGWSGAGVTTKTVITVPPPPPPPK